VPDPEGGRQDEFLASLQATYIAPIRKQTVPKPKRSAVILKPFADQSWKRPMRENKAIKLNRKMITGNPYRKMV